MFQIKIKNRLTSNLAIFGLTLLLTFPFPLINVYLLPFITLINIIFFNCNILNQKIIFSNKIYNNLRVIIKYLFFIFLFLFSSSLLNLIYLFVENNTLSSLEIKRVLTQLFSHLLYSIFIISGYLMFFHINHLLIKKVIIFGFVITLLICGYQYIAYNFSLPYVGVFVNDKVIGLRFSSLSLEPKMLSAYLILLIFYLIEILYTKVRRSISLFSLLTGTILLAFYFFIYTGSGLGVFSLTILLIILYFKLNYSKKLLYLTIVVCFLFFLLNIDITILGIREVHLGLLNNLSSFNILMLDDLIFLPLITFESYPINFSFGFGAGLMHFYALNFLDNATWVTGKESYIEGGISALMYIANYGFIFFSVFSYLFLKKAFTNIKLLKDRDNILDSFFLNSFILGLILTGNVSIPFFISIGWILARSVTFNNKYE
jgi:hypothetical protein